MFSSGMFSSGNPSSRYQRQEVAHSKFQQGQLASPNRFYQDPYRLAKDQMNMAASDIIGNVEGFKATLQTAITAYLNEIESKYFRFMGRRRAESLRKNIASARTIEDVILALNVVLTEGNEEKDSLKTFLLKAIDLEFGQNQIVSLMPWKVSSTNILTFIFNAISNQVRQPICMKDFSDSHKSMTGKK